MPDVPVSAAAMNHAAIGVATVPGVGPVDDVVAVAIASLHHPGLVVLAGAPGSGRSTALRRLTEDFRGPVFAGGGLAMLRGSAGFALTRAVRVRLPLHDVALLAEAVRSRVRGGLLVLDDLQWVDPLSLAALPAIAVHCRIAVTVRLPHRIPAETERALHAAAVAWLTVPPLSVAAAAALVGQVAPAASPAAVAAVVRRAGGVPLAITALARRLTVPGGEAGEEAGERGLVHAIAVALADLTRPARTGLAALGLLGRPADQGLLGDGVDELVLAGLVEVDGGLVTAVSPYTAEVAAGLLDPVERRALHRRLAELVPPREAARHLAAAGAGREAYEVAVAAADKADSTGAKAELLLLACDLPDVTCDPQVRQAAARAALGVGRPGACLRVLTSARGAAAAVLRAEAYLQQGAVRDAAAAVAGVTDIQDPDIAAGRDRILLLVSLATDPVLARQRLSEVLAVHGYPPRHAGLRAAVAAVRAVGREAGWEFGLATAAAAAGGGGEPLAARWSAWLLVETLAADGRLREAAQAAQAAARACAADLAYSWQTRFVAAELWCVALRGGGIDDVIRRATELTDRTLPEVARGYAVAAVSLVEADSGLLTAARARLAAVRGAARVATAVLDWVSREAAWLDGQPELAVEASVRSNGSPLLDGLGRITARWAAHDSDRGAAGVGGVAAAPDDLEAIRRTLEAWTAPDGFAAAATAWHGLALREEIRCLLACGVLSEDPAVAVPSLLAAERLAEEAGLVVLLGRTRRALRRHAVRRDTRGRRAGEDLTDREREILGLVARGEPTRRIAGRLGISRETVETHIRSGMRKLGARTRTEAAALAIEVLP